MQTIMVRCMWDLFHHFLFFKEKDVCLPTLFFFLFLSRWKTQITYCYFFFCFLKVTKAKMSWENIDLCYFISWRKIFTERKQVTQKTAQVSSFWTWGYFEHLQAKWIVNSSLKKQKKLWLTVIYLSTEETIVSRLWKVKLHHLFTFILHIQRHKCMPPWI